jgi:hypothetical protein
MAPESERAQMCEHDAGGMYDGPTNIWCALGCGALLECVCIRNQYCLVHPSLSRTLDLFRSSGENRVESAISRRL